MNLKLRLRTQVELGILLCFTAITLVALLVTWYVLKENPSIELFLSNPNIENFIKDYRYVFLFFAMIFELYIWKIKLNKHIKSTLVVCLFFIGFCFSAADLPAFILASFIGAAIMAVIEVARQR